PGEPTASAAGDSSVAARDAALSPGIAAGAAGHDHERPAGSRARGDGRHRPGRYAGAGEAGGQEGSQEEAPALPAQEGEAEVPHRQGQAREGEARAVQAADQDREGGERQVVLRRPGYLLGLVAAIVG